MDVANWPINPVDIGVVVVLLLSALLAFARGFIREVLSVAGWIGAALVAVYLFPTALPYTQRYISQEMAAKVATGAGLFIISLTVFSLLGHFIARAFEGPAINPVNRGLGFLFGLARGALLVCLAYLMLIWLLPQADQRPAWIREARTLPLIERGTELIESALPEELLRQADQMRDQTERSLNPADRITRTPQPASPEPSGPPRYDGRQIEQRLQNQ